jgi:hypothetical protein
MRENNEGIKIRGNGYTPHNCEACNEEFVGRRNAKFCSATCKNNFNNARIRGRDGVIRKYYRIIEKNYKILTETLESGIEEISHLDLIKVGYKADFFTSRPIYKGQDKSFHCFACCDLVLIPYSENTYKIQRNDRL